MRYNKSQKKNGYITFIAGKLFLPQRAPRYYTKFTKSRLLTLTFRSGYDIKRVWALALKKSYHITNLLFFVSHTKKSNKRKVSAGEMI